MTGWPGKGTGAGRRGVRRAARKCTRAWQGVSGGRPGGQAEACSGEDEENPLKAGSGKGEETLLEAGIGEDKGEVEGGPLLEGLEGGTPREGKLEGGPLLEGPEDLEEGHPREGVASGTGQGSGSGVSSGAGE